MGRTNRQHRRTATARSTQIRITRADAPTVSVATCAGGINLKYLCVQARSRIPSSFIPPGAGALMAAIRKGKKLKSPSKQAEMVHQTDCEDVNRMKASCAPEYTDCLWVGQEKPYVHKKYAASSEECLSNPYNFEKKLGTRINAYRHDKFARQTRSNQQRCESTRGCQWTGKRCSNENLDFFDQFGDVLADRRNIIDDDDDDDDWDDWDGQ